MKRLNSVLTALLVAGTALVPGARAADGLTDPSGHVTFEGSFTDAASPSVPELYLQPGTCQVLTCHEHIVEVDLPEDVWSSPGGVQIAVDWFPHEDLDLDLYVFGPDGSLAGRSDGFFASTGESVRIQDAPDGSYRVVVVPRYVEGTLRYDGLAEVEYAPAVEPTRDLLPNLVALPARNPHLRTGAYLLDHGVEGTPSCYPEETFEQGARRCLRFDQIIGNFGDGPLELRYRMEGLGTEQRLEQRIFRSDGTHRDRFADTYEFHAAHAHFHYKTFGQAKLYRETPEGLELLRTGRKNGFCLIDVENTNFGPGRKGEAPRTYYFPRCNAPTERDENGTYMTNGISVGWADVYNWFLADQFIEITGIPDGEYVLETIANPANTVHETSLADNSSFVRIRLRGDTVELLP